MILISKKSTKRIVKGLRYEATSVHNATPLAGTVYIKDMGWYSINNFTDTDGKPVPKVHITGVNHQPLTLQATDLVIGEKLVCITDSYKTFKQGARYEIETLTTKRITTYYTQTLIKFKGIGRSIKFSPYSFRKLNTDELRATTLNLFFEEEDTIEEVAVNKERVMMEVLSKSILDRNRHHLSILDWGVQQISRKKSSKNEYDALMEMTLKDILKIIE